MTIDPREFRNAVGCFATGITIITTVDGDGSPVGFTANSFSSVSLDPPLVLFSLARDARSIGMFESADSYAVNVLGEDQKDEDRRKLDADVLPYMGSMSVRKIDYNLVDAFIDHLVSERGLSASSLKKYVILIRKVMKEAERDGVITGIPAYPSIKSVQNPRPWFTPEQYSKLLSACRELQKNPPTTGDGTGGKGVAPFAYEELYDFIVFMIHTFLRPSEWKLLQNKHIRVMDTNGVKQLVISVPNPKTKKASGSIDSTSTEVAADIYLKRILKRHDNPND